MSQCKLKMERHQRKNIYGTTIMTENMQFVNSKSKIRKCWITIKVSHRIWKQWQFDDTTSLTGRNWFSFIVVRGFVVVFIDGRKDVSFIA